MRIRTLKPEFWRSDDVAALDRDTRLLFISLWSYVDDNGVGRDSTALIAADTCAHDLEQDATGTLAYVRDGLATLAGRGLIQRYVGPDGRPYLAVTNWHHQKIDRPQPGRYPGPDQAIATESRAFETNARGLDEKSRGFDAVTGEQGNRGTGEQILPQPLTRSRRRPTTEDFNRFWNAYPRKAGKQEARRVFDKAVSRGGLEAVIAGARRLAEDPNLPEKTFVPHPATWLNRDGWEDEPLPPRPGTQTQPARQPFVPIPRDPEADAEARRSGGRDAQGFPIAPLRKFGS